MADLKEKLTIRDLPPEIFHNVLDQLGCHDRDALPACTLVCRDWLDISREHLFSELHVPRGLDESFEDLVGFLETHAPCGIRPGTEPRSNASPYPVQL